MPRKEKKTAAQLQEIVMQEVRKHHEWSYLRPASITPRVQGASHHASWDASFVCDGDQLRPAETDYIITRLQDQYELVGELSGGRDRVT
jgi:hypothetical protein